MSRRLRITVLVENTAGNQGLLGEHGLAYWIETGTHRVLFDTGQGKALAPNASRLRIDLRRADAIVLSHGHYDHTGGLRFAFHLARQAKLFLHPQALVCRYAGDRGRAREIGMASATRQALRQEARRLVWTSRPAEVIPGVYVTGEIPRRTDYEKTSGEFFLDAGGRVADPILDDQAVYMDTKSGVVVILGCAHTGVVNTLLYISAMTHRPIHAVIGGTHLVNASPRKIARTLSALRGMRLRVIAPAHCTGPRATAAFWNAFPQHVADCSVGTQWTFSSASGRRRS